MAGGAETGEVREAFASFARSLKRVSMYRHAIAEHRGYVEPAWQALRDLLSRRPSLTVTLEPGALRWQDEIVYSEPPRESGFCFRMHRDGIRSLTFRQGLSLDELLALSRVATADASDGAAREDAVTELWKLDLDHVLYTAASGYRMDQAGGESVTRNLAAVAERARRTLEESGGNALEAASPPALWSEEERSRRDPRDWSGLARRAALTILRIVEQDSAGRDLEALQDAFVRLLDEMAARGEAQSLSVALDRARRLEGAPARELRGTLGRHLAEPRRIERALELIGTERPPLLPLWLALLPPEAGPAVVAAMPLARTDEARMQLAAAALSRVASCVLDVESSLRHATPKVAHALLAAAHADRRPSFALAAAENRDPSIRAAALPLLAPDEDGLRVLTALLGHATREVRLGAAQALSGFAPLAERAASALIEAMSRPAFARADRDEQAAFHRALGRLASPSGFSFLFERLARPPRGLFGRRKGETEQLLAVQGLAEESSQRSLRALEEQLLPSRGHGPAVIAACRAAAQYVRSALRSGRTA